MSILHSLQSEQVPYSCVSLYFGRKHLYWTAFRGYDWCSVTQLHDEAGMKRKCIANFE